MVGVIAWFDELGKTDTATAGGKGANQGELTAARGTFASTWVPARSVTVRATAIRKGGALCRRRTDGAGSCGVVTRARAVAS